ncbi:MAG: AMP-binding protein [Eubacteriales bacterium]|nr:AMP-binding protein [Eubacteriales bacterium]
MQTVTGKTYYKEPAFSTIRDLIKYYVNQYQDMPAYRYHVTPQGAEVVHTYIEFDADIDAMGTALHNLGLRDTHIVVVGDNSYRWAVAHNAIINGTGVSVPIDRQLPQQEVINLAARGKARAFIYGARHHEIAKAAALENKEIQYFISMTDNIIEPELKQQDPRFISMSDLLNQGKSLLSDGNRDFLDNAIDPSAMCSLLFTSGTTAMSKGVMLSHENIAANVHSAMSTIHVEQGQNALSVLPLHHTFENTVGMYMMLAFGVCICFTDGLRYFSDNLKEWKINILLAVPLLFENVYKQIQKTLIKTGKLTLVNRMRKISNILRKIGIDKRRKIFHQIIDGVGGGLNLCVSGAAAIDKEIVAFFNDIGIEFLAGYGLTETSPVISVCNQFVNVYGSVGNPLAGIEAAIDTDESAAGSIGEILTRSKCVMLGYYENDEATREVMTDDGWLKTGDIGYLDKKGCIHITGRKKSMIVLTNGKKAFPEEIEYLINKTAGIKDSLAWGDESSRDGVDICVRLTVEKEMLPEGIDHNDDSIGRYLADSLKAINQEMPPYKAIKYFFWNEQDMIKTTTLKIKRPQETARVAEELSTRGFNMKQANGKRIDFKPFDA